MFELACHLVDAVVTLLGPPTEVAAFAAATKGPEDPLPDNQLAVLSYPRALATLRCNHADPGGTARRAFAVVGQKGSLEIHPLESGRIRLVLEKEAGGFAKGEHAIDLPLPEGRYDGEFLFLKTCLRGQQDFPWTARHDIDVHAVAMRAAGLDPEAAR
jgi:predicted dehydrogenase